MLHLIWDFDGTLVDTKEDILNCLYFAVQKAGLSIYDQRAEFKIGPTIDKILEDAFPPTVMDSKKMSDIVQYFRESYDCCGFLETFSFPGIDEIVHCKHFMHHIITNKPDMTTKKIIEKLNWNGVFQSVSTPYSFIGEIRRLLSKEELFARCIWNYPNEIFIGIGDMGSDCIAAAKNGIPSVGVLWGSGTECELRGVGCTYIVSNTKELFGVLKSL